MSIFFTISDTFCYSKEEEKNIFANGGLKDSNWHKTDG